MIKRVFDDLGHFLRSERALIIYGPRRVGKTTLLKNFLAKTPLRYKLDTGDNMRTQNRLGSLVFDDLFEYVEGYELLALDEAQLVPNIGKALKILADHRPALKIIATGSSSFDLSQAVGEPLTGRKHVLTLYPIAQSELLNSGKNRGDLSEQLSEFLIFGSYPDVVTARSRATKKEILYEIVDSYLLKDVLSLDRIRGSRVLFDLLKLVAFQVGNEVSLNELAGQVKIDVKTVARYLDVLEKTFVLKSLGGFSRNLRSEVTQKQKYYFLDNGVRNAVISQFQPLSDRNDLGALWENFLFVERLKKRTYAGDTRPSYFWRTYSQNEIDFVEESDGKISTFEAKWSPAAKHRLPREWSQAYPLATHQVVHSKNYFDFIL